MSINDDLISTLSPVLHHNGTTPITLAPCELTLSVIKFTALAIAFSITSITLLLILCHRGLRKRHQIFPFNIVLADLTGAVLKTAFDLIDPVVELEMIIGLLLQTTMLVSLVSILLVAGYQFITIRIDPFGSRNIITTPRLVVTCLVTWAISCALSLAFPPLRFNHQIFFILATSWSTTIISGLCYICIYRSVARMPCDGNITPERKEQNQRVLLTFGLIFGSNVLCWIFPWINWAVLQNMQDVRNDCLTSAGDVMIIINWIINSIIYWWRLKEFRSMLTLCKRNKITVDPQP